MTTFSKPDPGRTYATSQVLAMARERIATPDTYRPGEAAYDRQGESVAADVPAAVKWSGWGALEALGLGAACTPAVQLLEQTAKALFDAEFITVDDKQGHAAVLAVYDGAIAKAKTAEAKEAPGHQQPTNGRQGGLPFAGRDQRPQTPTAARPAAATSAPAAGPSNGGAVAVRPKTGVARVEQLCGIVTDLSVALDRLNELRANANVCFPAARPDFIAPFHSLAIRTVAIDSTNLPREAIRKPGESADWYYEKQSRGWALSKIALDKFAVALGVSWHPLATGRVDDESEPLYCRFRAVGVYLAFDGRELTNTQHKTVDLRAKSAQTAGMSDLQLGQARKFVQEQAESKAKNRVMRAIAFLKSSYTAEEATRPFVVLAPVLTGATDDPELKRMIAEKIADRALSTTARLYGPPPTPVEIPDLGARTAPPPAGTTDDDPEPGDDDVPPYMEGR